MIEDRLHLLLLGLAAILLLTGLYFSREIPDDIAAIRNRPLQTEDSTARMRLSLINSAVKEESATNYFEYTGGFQNPFKVWNASRIHSPNKPGNSSKKIVRTKFILKGILTKNKPLAILEDGMGETYIRGTGDKALDQIIVAIEKNRVTMRDRLGTYELVVEDN